ncbi:NPC intracellular cholesterol transporter 1 homolog 1b isoform X2 [Rosa chinensis]|uniref:NPC intracellular cholesterol transporter 1 homolog 1b isoform X2 n=1 Tax=Rosa chinensis TaxID=74649 RepID=UPI001AD935C9|nr:NPC intracellular cholesterol transporter 1 homolog 1b isoform X2 [Rosa chinensis]
MHLKYLLFTSRPSAVRVKSTLIIMEVIPCLVLAVGVDNMCILVHAITGVTFRMTMGSFIPMPACRVFSMIAALAVLMDFFLQVTAFVALIYFDLLRAEDGRFDCFPCIKVSSSFVESTEGHGLGGF